MGGCGVSAGGDGSGVGCALRVASCEKTRAQLATRNSQHMSVYIHGTSESEQRRLSLLNDVLLNQAMLREMALRGDERIVDFGSGLGQFSRAMARAVPRGRVVGIERDFEQLRSAHLDMQAQLEQYGISAEEAAARVDALTDREVALVADRLDEVPAGGNAGLALLIFWLYCAVCVLAAVVVVVGIVALIVYAATKAAKARKHETD